MRLKLSDTYLKNKQKKNWLSKRWTGRLSNLFLLISFLFLSFTVYSNTLQSSWHLDDYPNIVLNTKLHIQNLNFASIVQTFHSHPSFDNTALYRPIACFTFALNWLFGGPNVYGYHIVNTIIHALTGFMVYLATYLLLVTPNIKNHFTNHKYSIAIISACIWLAHPIQTEAVTYIVQRMALLAGLFYVTALYCYINARLTENTKKKVILFFLSFVSFAGGLLSKENTVVFPILIIITEYVFFLDHTNKKRKRSFLITAGLIGTASLLIAISAYYLQPYRIEHLYAKRSFTFFERIYSENRIILFYLSQIFAPSLDKLSLFHDITLSKNIFFPITTAPALVLNIALVVFGITKAQKYPLWAFAILTFYCGHLVESTFLPLELIFEHRNYIPSMFIFLPMVALAFNFTDKKSNSKILNKIILPCLALSLVLILGVMTYQRNSVWRDSETLWMDVYKKAPKNARANQNLAMVFQEKGRYDIAIALYKDSLNKNDPSPAYSRYLVYNNLGTIYTIMGDYKTAISYYQKAEKEKPGETKTLYNATLAYIQKGDFPTAGKMLDRALTKDPSNYHFLNTKGFTCLKQNNYAQSLIFFRKSISLRPFDRNAMLNIIMAMSGLGRYDRADWFLQIAEKRYPNDILFLLASLEMNIRAKNQENITSLLNKLVAGYSKEVVKNEVITSATGANTSPFHLAMIKNAIDRYDPNYFK